MNKKGVYELCSYSSRDSGGDVFVGLLSVSRISFTSVFSSITNRFFLHDFVANNFVPGENYCECLQTGFALSLPLE
jgi:hypothetical protein